MAKGPQNKKPTVARAEAERFLGATPYMKGFHFYTAIGNYTEETATNLSELAKMLQTIAESSIAFHFQRQDFQKWIRATIGDHELAGRMDKIKVTPSIEDLRNRLIRTVQTRITELEELSGGQ